MQATRILAGALVALSLSLVGVGRIGTTQAATGPRVLPHSAHGHAAVHRFAVPSGSTYDVEAYNNACAGGGSSCYCPTVGGSCVPTPFPSGYNITPGYTFNDAEAYGFNGYAQSVPKYVYLECDRAYTGADGLVHYQYAYIDAGHNDVGGYYFGDLGTTGGYAGVNSTGSETENPSSGGMNVSASDASQQYLNTGSGTGSQTADNNLNLPIAGGFTVTIRGTLYNEHYVSGTGWVFDPNSNGTINCTAGGAAGNASPNNFPLAENEIEPLAPGS